MLGTQASAEKRRKSLATHILPNKTNQTPFLQSFLTKRGIKDMCMFQQAEKANKLRQKISCPIKISLQAEAE